MRAMHEVRQRMMVSESGEIVVTLPTDFPRGEVEVTVVAAEDAGVRAVVNLNRRRDEMIASLSPAPSSATGSGRRLTLSQIGSSRRSSFSERGGERASFTS